MSNRLFSTSIISFRYKMVSHKSPLFSIFTVVSKDPSFLSIWLHFSRTSSLQNITLFKLFRISFMLTLSQWSSLTILVAYRSAPPLNSTLMRTAQLRTARNVWLHSVPSHIPDRMYSGSKQCKALWIHCYCTRLPTCISFSTVAPYALGPCYLRGHLPMWCCWLNDDLQQYVQCGYVQTCIITEIVWL